MAQRKKFAAQRPRGGRLFGRPGKFFSAAPLQTGSRAAFLPPGLRQIAAREGRWRGAFSPGQSICRRARNPFLIPA
jgi:hypothetical protein